MLDCGMNRCMCIEDTTIDGVNVGEIYQYMYIPEYEITPTYRTYIIFYNDGQDFLSCIYSYFQQYFLKI